MTGVAVVGAGPYGLSIAAHLREHGVPFRIFGEPLDNWRHHMPVGMTLKSQPFASSLSDPLGEGTLAKYCAARDIPYDDIHIPVSLELFNSYGLDFARRFVPDLEKQQVTSVARSGEGFELKLDDGSTLEADHVVAAVGITHFGEIPAVLAGLPEELVSHSSAHNDLSGFAGRDVTVVGAGASAVDIATLLHEAGARVSLISRGAAPKFYPLPQHGPRSPWERICHPSAALGPSFRFWLYERRPSLFRLFPGPVRLKIIDHALGPATPDTMKARFEAGVAVSIGESIEQARVEQGRLRLVLESQGGSTRETVTDHVIAATGYQPRLSSLDFLSDELRSSIQTYAQMPLLSSNFESSARGLFFVGLSAVGSFGPLMRFVAGASYVAPRLTRELRRRVTRSAPEDERADAESHLVA